MSADKTLYPGKQYGILGGRFQGWHKSHQYNADEVRRCGLTPVIFVSTGVKEGDFYGFDQVAAMIKLANPDLSADGNPPTIIEYSSPPRDFEAWVDTTLAHYQRYGFNPQNTVLFEPINYASFEQDLFDATYKGVTLEKTYYTLALAELKGFTLHTIDKSAERERERSARNARQNLFHHLDDFHSFVAAYLADQRARSILNKRPIGGDPLRDTFLPDPPHLLEAHRKNPVIGMAASSRTFAHLYADILNQGTVLDFQAGMLETIIQKEKSANNGFIPEKLVTALWEIERWAGSSPDNSPRWNALFVTANCDFLLADRKITREEMQWLVAHIAQDGIFSARETELILELESRTQAMPWIAKNTVANIYAAAREKIRKGEPVEIPDLGSDPMAERYNLIFGYLKTIGRAPPNPGTGMGLC